MNIAQKTLPIADAAFEALREIPIPALNIRLQHFRHRSTGAEHYHLASDNTENVFLVALRTVPRDSTGVAHILEHTALCGSERYPVRDPFFMMLRRSLNTFMNAFTSSDWTAYPFASQNRKDFGNLLEVYLDAVFFSRLDPLDFAQEGHRVEFAEEGNPDSALVYKGVVYNEMKGAMSSVNATLWQTLCAHLFPDSTYHYNSGGDPEVIPQLSYEQLLAFYRTHYHPSNAIFMTYGDIPAHEHQAVFEARALQRFTALPERIAVAAQPRLGEPLQVVEPYAYDEDEDTTAKTHIVVGWMLGESMDLEQLLEAQLLASVLLENSASPLQQALETTDLGTAPSPLCGLEDAMRELVFCAGVEGSEPEHAAAVEALVLGVIEQVAREGVPEEQLEAVLHQLELHQREVGGDGFPYGLSLILQALGCATHYADPVQVLDLDPVLATLRERIADPQYIRRLAQRLLLDNRHRITLTLHPDTTLSARRKAEETERLAKLRAALDEAQRQQLLAQAAALRERQARVDDPEVLPRVTLEDVPAELPQLQYREQRAGALAVTSYEQGTNGLVYQQLVTPLHTLGSEDWGLLPHYSSLVTELGVGEDGYLRTQQRQSATVGGIHLSASLRGAVADEQQVQGYLVLSSKALLRNAEPQLRLMRDTCAGVNFTEHNRIAELVSQRRARRDAAITGSGHSLAMLAACAGMSPLAQLQHAGNGLAGTRALRALDRQLQDADGRAAFATALEQLHARLYTHAPELLTVSEPGTVDALLGHAAALWPSGHGAAVAQDALLPLPALRESRRECWLANTQVNFCARAYPTVPVGHPDAAALSVLGGYLRNGYLHRAIREQGGAYGGGAGQDPLVAAFRFYSYRDPRLEETLEDFDASVRWLIEQPQDAHALEEAILGVISSLDKPGSPAGEAKQDFYNRRFGRSHAQRMAFRQAVLGVSLGDLRRVAEAYLQPEQASTAVIISARDEAAAQRLQAAYGCTPCEL